MKKYILSVIACFFIQLAAVAQTAPQLPNIVPPSPTVANLMNFEEVPVDNYSGQPDISIPLFSKQLNSELSLPIVLRYSTSGVRIEQRSGWTGTGWSLEAGGVISRTVRGVADETWRDGSTISTGIFHNDDFWMFDDLEDPDKNEFIWNVNGTASQKYDSEPDLFQYSFMGNSGRFVVVKAGGTLRAKLLSQDQKIKIHIFHNSNYVISGYMITDANGYKYTFGQGTDFTETSTTQQNVISVPMDGGAGPVAYYPPVTTNSAWHLVNITTTNSESLVNFTYTNSQEVYEPPVSMTENILQGNWDLALQNAYSKSQFRPLHTASTSVVTTQTKKLNKITFRDKSYIDFSLNASAHPENGGKYLSNIIIRNPGVETVKSYALSYETFNDRLWLTAVTGTNGENYTLEYNDKEHLPNHEGEKDGWGYNKSDWRDDITKGYNYYDYSAVTKGLLKRINYPTGGYREFTFESNTFTYEGDQMVDNFDDNPGNSYIETINHSYTASTKNIGTQTAADSFTLSHDQYVYVDATDFPTSPYAGIMVVQIDKSGGGQTLVDVSGSARVVYLTAGDYTCKVRVKLLETLGTSYTVTGNLTVKYMKPYSIFVVYKKYLLGGGPRIARIDFVDPNDTANPVQLQANYSYESIDPLDESQLVSSGSTDARVGNMKKEYLDSDRRYLFFQSVNIGFTVDDITYRVRTNEPNIQLTKGNYVGYKKVRVSEYKISPSAPVPNGYTDYTYTTAQDFPQSAGVFSYPFSPAQNLDYKRGLLLTRSVYDKDAQKLQEQVNSYAYKTDAEAAVTSFTVRPSPCEWRQFYETYENYQSEFAVYKPVCGGTNPTACFADGYHNCTVVAPYLVMDTTIKGGRAELAGTLNREYFYPGAAMIETSSAYTYNDDNYQPATKTDTYLEGTSTITYETSYQYPFTNSYTASYFTADEITEMANMVELNIINKPVTVTSTRNGSVLNRVITKYDTFGYNQILPKEVETLKGTNAAEDRMSFYKYNSIGNVQEVGMTNGSRVCYVWGYYDTLPVAKIENCNYSAITPATILTIQNESMAAGSEANLRTALNSLRTLLTASQVTTIIYNTLKGATEITDPRAMKQTFTYESPGMRLLNVKDNDGKLLSENQYNFRQ